MKVLFLSVTAGQVIIRPGRPPWNAFLETMWNVLCWTHFEYINPFPRNPFPGYLISTRFSPSLYGRMYRLAEKLKNNIKMFVSKFTLPYGQKLTTYRGIQAGCHSVYYFFQANSDTDFARVFPPVQ